LLLLLLLLPGSAVIGQFVKAFKELTYAYSFIAECVSASHAVLLLFRVNVQAHGVGHAMLGDDYITTTNIATTATTATTTTATAT